MDRLKIEKSQRKNLELIWKFTSPAPWIFALIGLLQAATGLVKLPPMMDSEAHPFLLVAFLVAAFAMLGIPVIINKLQSAGFANASVEIEQFLRAFKIEKESWDRFSEQEKADLLSSRRTYTLNLIAWIFAAGIGVDGFILFLLFGRVEDIFIFAIISYLGFRIYSPKTGSSHRITQPNP